MDMVSGGFGACLNVLISGWVIRICRTVDDVSFGVGFYWMWPNGLVIIYDIFNGLVCVLLEVA